MLIIPPSKPRKHRPRPKAKTTPPLVVTEVVSAEIVESDLVVQLRVDTTAENPVNVDSATGANWTGRYGNQRHVGVTPVALDFDLLQVSLVPDGPETGDNQIAYAANPSDITDASGRMLGAFEMSL